MRLARPILSGLTLGVALFGITESKTSESSSELCSLRLSAYCAPSVHPQEPSQRPKSASYFSGDFSVLLGTSDSTAPRETLLSWLRDDNKASVGSLRKANDKEYQLFAKGEIADLKEYLLDEDLQATLESNPELRWIRVNDISAGKSFPWICSVGSLNGLSMRFANLSDADVMAFESLTKLKWLDLFGAKLPDDQDFVFPKMPSLEVLILPGRWPTDRNIANLRGLRALSVRRGSLTDDGISRLVINNPELTYFNICYNEDVSNQSISHLGKLKKLKFLQVAGTLIGARNDRGQEARTRLRMELPDCYIEIGD